MHDDEYYQIVSFFSEDIHTDCETAKGGLTRNGVL